MVTTHRFAAHPAPRKRVLLQARHNTNAMTASVPALDLKAIAAAYASGATSPSQLVQALHPQLAAAPAMFIHLAPLQQLLERAAALEAQPEGSRGALWGVPFATKDNVDVAGMPTTAACPAFSYVPEKSAAAVQALEDAGEQSWQGRTAPASSTWQCQLAAAEGSTVAGLTHQQIWHVSTACMCALLRQSNIATWLSTRALLMMSLYNNTMVACTTRTALCPVPCPCPCTHMHVLCCCLPGGINFGKTNLDQFASGLVGTRTPYGTARNAFDSRFIPGGSSSGSAAAVGAGLLCFALGTDTAGSGRVPAGYNGCVGLKGTLGKISTAGGPGGSVAASKRKQLHGWSICRHHLMVALCKPTEMRRRC